MFEEWQGVIIIMAFAARGNDSTLHYLLSWFIFPAREIRAVNLGNLSVQIPQKEFNLNSPQLCWRCNRWHICGNFTLNPDGVQQNVDIFTPNFVGGYSNSSPPVPVRTGPSG